MKRRTLLKVGGGTALAATAGMSQAQEKDSVHWKLAMTWPKGYPGLATGMQWFAEQLEAATDGRFKITIYGAGELVPAFEVFNAVKDGTIQLGHGPAYYWKGIIPASEVFSGLPFGMTPVEMDAWYQFGGGDALINECYAPFGVMQKVCGNADLQMGGWFNREINSLADLKGLKIRIPGIAAEIYKMSGATPVNMPGSEIFTSLQTGVIDAADWVGPWNDRAFGLQKVAKYYYGTWHEPGTPVDLLINAEAYNALPKDLQVQLDLVARAAGARMLSEYRAHNARALQELVDKDGTELRVFPEDVIATFKENTKTYLQERSAEDEFYAKVLTSYQDFLAGQRIWSDNERTYLQTRV